MGRIFDACTMAGSSPADALGQGTGLGTIRAAGLSPNDVRRASVVCRGPAPLTADGAMVSDPVATGLLLPGRDQERQAIHHDVLDPHPPVRGQVLDEPLSHLTFHSAVLAWPSSSMVRAITTACARESALPPDHDDSRPPS
jgi:hypothetical protein